MILTVRSIFISRYIIIIIGLFSFAPLKAQYELNVKKDIIIGGSALGVFAAGNILEYLYDKPLTADQIMALDRNDVNSFDRSATFNWNPESKKASDFVVTFMMLSPGLLMFDDNAQKDWLTIGFMYAESLALLQGINSLTKITFRRTRPFVYNENAPVDMKLNIDARKSFFSAHTSMAFNGAVFLSTVASSYLKSTELKVMVWSISLAGASAVGYFRYAAGKHYPSDILTGAAVGAFTGFLIPYLHKTDEEKDQNGLLIAPEAGPQYMLISFSYRF